MNFGFISLFLDTSASVSPVVGTKTGASRISFCSALVGFLGLEYLIGVGLLGFALR